MKEQKTLIEENTLAITKVRLKGTNMTNIQNLIRSIKLLRCENNNGN